MIAYALYDWEFDYEKFGAELGVLERQFSRKFLADLLELDVATLGNWQNGMRGNGKFKHPSMSNFITFCNEFDKDPRQYFRLKDK